MNLLHSYFHSHTFFTVSPRGTVVINPVNASVSVGEDVSLTCSAMGGPRNLFQWYRRGFELPGENGTVLTLTNITLTDGAEYLCQVRNFAEAFNASTFVLIDPRITQHPSNVTATNGNQASLMCLAEAFPDPTYQWVYSNGSDIDLESVLGTDTDTLQFQPVEFGSEGSYVCTATANNVTATSDVAILFGKLQCVSCICHSFMMYTSLISPQFHLGELLQ